MLTTKFRSDYRIHDNYVYIFVQQPDGLLAAPQRYVVGANTFTTSLALADMDNDGIKDILIGHVAGISLLTRRPSGPRSVVKQLVAGNSCWAVAPLDIDGDGNTDVRFQRQRTS